MYNTWLKVEIATCEAWNELGIIPDKDLEKIKLIQFGMKKYDKYFDETFILNLQSLLQTLDILKMNEYLWAEKSNR